MADSIEYYVFSALREKDRKMQSIEALNGGCDFYSKVKSSKGANGFLEAEINDRFAPVLAGMISRYIFDEASDSVDDDMEWLCEMMSIYRQVQPAEKDENVERDMETEEKMIAAQQGNFEPDEEEYDEYEMVPDDDDLEL